METVESAQSAPEQLIHRLLLDALARYGWDRDLSEQQLTNPPEALVKIVGGLVREHFNQPGSPNCDEVLVCPRQLVSTDWVAPLADQLGRLSALVAGMPGARSLDVASLRVERLPVGNEVGPVVLLPKIGWLAHILKPAGGKYWDVYAKFNRATRWAIDWLKTHLGDQFEDGSSCQSDDYTRQITGLTCDEVGVGRRRMLEESQPGSVMVVAVDFYNTLGGEYRYSPRRANQEIVNQGRYPLSLVDLAWIVTLNPSLAMQQDLKFTCPFGKLEVSIHSYYERDGCREGTGTSGDGVYCAFVSDAKVIIGSHLGSDMRPDETMLTASFAPVSPA